MNINVQRCDNDVHLYGGGGSDASTHKTDGYLYVR